MEATTVTPTAARELIKAAVRGAFTEEEARCLARFGPEVAAFVFLAASQRIAEQKGESQAAQVSPATPSGMVPVHTKPNRSKRRKKPGAKPGHEGVRRNRPTRVDERNDRRASSVNVTKHLFLVSGLLALGSINQVGK